MGFVPQSLSDGGLRIFREIEKLVEFTPIVNGICSNYFIEAEKGC